MCLLLALTGNWGKKGAGVGSWNSFLFDGMSTVMMKSKPGPEGGMEVLNLARAAREQLCEADPSLTGELPDRVLWRAMAAGGRSVTADWEVCTRLSLRLSPLCSSCT